MMAYSPDMMIDPLALAMRGTVDSALVVLSEPGGDDKIRLAALREMEQRAEVDGEAASRYAHALMAISVRRAA